MRQSLCDLAFASSASLLQASLTNFARKNRVDLRAKLDFTKLEISQENIEVFKKVIQSGKLDAVIEYYKPLRMLLAVTKVKTCYEEIFGTPWAHDTKNSWLWFFYQNTESETLSFQFQDWMDFLKYKYIIERSSSYGMECKRLKLQGLPFGSYLPV